MIARGKRLIVRTVAFQQVIAVTFFSANLMQASSLIKRWQSYRHNERSRGEVPMRQNEQVQSSM
jgi:hypothetical protein